MTTLASILAVLALMFGGGAGTVYAAQDSLPNETLYPVKLYSEEFRMNMAGEPDEAFALALQFAQRRGDEIKTMMNEGVEPTAENMLQLAQQTQMAVQLAGELDGEAKLKVQNMIQNQMRRMLNLQGDASEEGAMLMQQTHTALQMQLMLAGGEAGAGAGQGQNQNQGQGQGQDQDQGQGGPAEDPGQGQNQGESQGQGPADGSGQPETAPGEGNAGETGEQFQNQGEDPCAAYYASLAKAGSGGQGGGSGKGQDGQGESQGPVYGLNGQICVPPTLVPTAVP